MADDLSLKSAVIDAVQAILDPVSGRSILDAHLLDGVEVAAGVATIKLQFGAAHDKKARWAIEDAVQDKVEKLDGVREVRVNSFSTEIPAPPSAAAAAAPASDAGEEKASNRQPKGAVPAPTPAALQGVGRVIAVASGKGGVGKSTVAVNLALALRQLGFRVGLLDVDVYGPSLPTLLGVNERPDVRDRRIQPLVTQGLKLMSLGFLMDGDAPVIWRGPIVTGIIRQFLQDVDWEGTDYLIVDMPPGTGDAQLSLAQTVPVDGAVVVTTPSDLALVDAARGLRMFQTLNIDVLGIVENMAWYDWPGANEMSAALDALAAAGAPASQVAQAREVLETHRKLWIFGKDGGAREAERLATPFLGHIPLDGDVRAGGDRGEPIQIAAPESAVAQAFLQLARRVAEAKPLPTAEDGGKRKGLFSFLKS